MKNWLLGLLVVVAYWFQLHFLGSWRPFGVVPNLFLVLTIYTGLVRSASQTVALALAAGLLLDLSSGTDFGLRMGFFCVMALAIVVARQAGVDFDNIGLVLVVVVAGTILFNLCVLAGVIVSRASISWSAVFRAVTTETGLNLLLALVVRPIFETSVRRVGLGAHGS